MTLLWGVIVIGALCTEMKGQTATFKALFLYNFTKNIDWPSSAENSDLVITVLGDHEIEAELKKIAKVKKSGNKPIRIASANSIKEIPKSHIIFLGSAKSALMSNLSHANKSNAVLLVADKKGLCSNGAGITFLTVNGKLRYEISQNQIESQRLKVTQKIVSLGIAVE